MCASLCKVSLSMHVQLHNVSLECKRTHKITKSNNKRPHPPKAADCYKNKKKIKQTKAPQMQFLEQWKACQCDSLPWILEQRLLKPDQYHLSTQSSSIKQKMICQVMSQALSSVTPILFQQMRAPPPNTHFFLALTFHLQQKASQQRHYRQLPFLLLKFHSGNVTRHSFITLCFDSAVLPEETVAIEGK